MGRTSRQVSGPLRRPPSGRSPGRLQRSPFLGYLEGGRLWDSARRFNCGAPAGKGTVHGTLIKSPFMGRIADLRPSRCCSYTSLKALGVRIWDADRGGRPAERRKVTAYGAFRPERPSAHLLDPCFRPRSNAFSSSDGIIGHLTYPPASQKWSPWSGFPIGGHLSNRGA